MRSFVDLDAVVGRVPASVVVLLSQVDSGRGSEAMYRDQMPGLLCELAHLARVASITTSSAIEGVVVPDEGRARRIINGAVTSLRTRNEQELAGYRDALDYLFQQEWRPVNTGLLLHLHRLLFAHTAVPGGTFKRQDNLVVDRSPAGEITVRFRPVPAVETDFHVGELVQRYLHAMRGRCHHPVLLVGLFVLDLLVIHPFEDGNGRVARVLTNALLADAGYGVVTYVSMEGAIAASEANYYRALLESTHGWHEGRFDPWPWLTYFVATLAGAYATFAERAAAGPATGNKQQRVRDFVLRLGPSTVTVSDIRAALSGVSDQTIRLVLSGLRDEGLIRADGTGRSAKWQRLTS
ncbi:Fic family protein [Nonomuraea sp. NPDC046570]|uniref:Fic family protein n=1 Tax=Nonomuraea sp. NPDC046570 TaxID=3155255 RepID=UPI0033DBFE2D